MPQTMQEIIDAIPDFCEKAVGVSEELLANLAMIGEIPSPSFGEEHRAQFLQDRFAEAELQNCSIDEMNNVAAILPGTENAEDRNILITAHLDDTFDEKTDRTVTLRPNHITGPGVGDNALGLAALATLPTLMENLGLEFRSNLVLMGDSKSLGAGNLEGMKFFLDNTKLDVQTGLCIEGVQMGRLSHSSIGMLRGEIRVRVPEEYDWTRFGSIGALITMNEILNRINEIPLPKRPRTTIVIGSIRSGNTYNLIATNAVMRFEIRSDSDEIVTDIHQQIESIAAEFASQTGADVELNVVARRSPGGLAFSHPLVRNSREIMKALDIPIRVSPSTSELTAFIERDIPALTVGLTQGEHLGDVDEALEIKPMFTGLAQVAGILLAIDRGYCNDA